MWFGQLSTSIILVIHSPIWVFLEVRPLFHWKLFIERNHLAWKGSMGGYQIKTSLTHSELFLSIPVAYLFYFTNHSSCGIFIHRGFQAGSGIVEVTLCVSGQRQGKWHAWAILSVSSSHSLLCHLMDLTESMFLASTRRGPLTYTL